MSLQNLAVVEQQISAIHDDGTDSGIIRAKISQGELINIPANALDMQLVATGSASLASSTTGFSNADGTSSAVNISTVPGLGTNIAVLNTVCYGKIIGVRYRRNATTPGFGVVIDGIPYDIPAYQQNQHIYNGAGIGIDREALWVVADDLPDMAHTVQLILYPSASVGNVIVFHGLLAERRAGYKETEKADILYGAGTLTGSAVVVPNTDAVAQIVKRLKSIRYNNTDSSARTVSIYHDSILLATLYLAAAGSTGDSVNYDFPLPGSNIGGNTANISHQASVTSVVKFKLIGAY